MLSFAPLLKTLQENGKTKTWLKTNKILVGGTYTAVMAATKEPVSEGISISAINRLCCALNCTPNDIMEYVPDDVTE